MFCPRCGRDNLPNARYCNDCGFALYEIQSLLKPQKDPEEPSEPASTGAIAPAGEPAVPKKKEDPKKPYVRTTSMLPKDPEDVTRTNRVPDRPVGPEKVTDPVAVQPSPAPVSGAVSQYPPAAVPERIRNPSLAAALSLLPGLGQVYNGMLLKGIILFVATILGLLIYIIPGACVWVFSIYDAFRTAEKINRGEMAFGPQKK